ncbi:MAG: family 20 glycosylhydrolase [Tepidisphaeraceae bacterium]
MIPDVTLIPRPRKCALRLDARSEGSAQTSLHSPALRPQGYRIDLNGNVVQVTSADPAGAFYACQTLAQLRRQFGDSLPQGTIEDWPDFAVRGVMLDISRDKVPTMATLFALVDLFAELKLNQLQLYTEHTFAYAQHETVWRDASPMTADEIRRLDRYCRDRHIELVPNQNSFGHLERWLKHKRYEPLAEKPDGFTFPWGTRSETGFSLNPLDPRSLALVEELFDELLPNFSSRIVNVGCDETADVGLGHSKAECERRGKERVYLDFVLKIYQALKRRDFTMQFWGDIILHKPELIPELPKDLIALNWGYEANHPFEQETKAFADAGVPFYVCPGTSSWCSLSGRTNNAIANLQSAAACGLANGAIGYLNTDWGDWGHLQYLPISYLGFAAGAAYSWCLDSNRDLDLAAALDLHVFRDPSRTMGKLMHDFGNVYQSVKTPLGNSSRLFWSLAGGEDRRKLWEPVTREEFDDAESRVAGILSRLPATQMDRPDAALIADEIRNTAAMLTHACRHGRWRQGDRSRTTIDLSDALRGILAEHRRLWLSRNRPGGLSDSCARLEARLAEYSSLR